MQDILRRFGIQTKFKKFYDALTTINGLSRWLVLAPLGHLRKDGSIDVRFSHMGYQQKVTRFESAG